MPNTSDQSLRILFRRRLRVLVAEDNAINRIIVVKTLEKLGHVAVPVENGLAAVGALQAMPYDAVLMDCQMPVMDGFEATRIIRDPDSQVLDRKIPIIALTAHALAGDRERCLEAGMNDYLAPLRNLLPAARAALQTLLNQLEREFCFPHKQV